MSDPDDGDWDDTGGMMLTVQYADTRITIAGSVDWTPEATQDYLARMVTQLRDLNAGLTIDATPGDA